MIEISPIMGHWVKKPKVAHTPSILLRQYYWYQWFNKGFLHKYRPYMINNFVQCGKIDNRIDRVWGP